MPGIGVLKKRCRVRGRHLVDVCCVTTPRDVRFMGFWIQKQGNFADIVYLLYGVGGLAEAMVLRKNGVQGSDSTMIMTIAMNENLPRRLIILLWGILVRAVLALR